MIHPIRPAFAIGFSLAAALHLLILAPGSCFGQATAPTPRPTPIPAPSPTGVPPPDFTAKVGLVQFVPSGANYSFENPVTGWTKSGDVQYTNIGTSAPHGAYVAALSGSTSVLACTGSFTPGTWWRLRFSAAQAAAGGSQTLRVFAGNVKVAEAEPVDNVYSDATTRPFAGTGTTQIRFEGATAGQAVRIDRIQAEQVFLWNSTISWQEGAVPTATSNVSIPANARIAIAGTTCVAATVNVKGALLVTTASVENALSARWVMVSGSGSLFEVGTEGVPFEQNFILTLTGNQGNTENIMGAGSKFLMAMGGGTIDLHGSPCISNSGTTPPTERPWVRLSGNAPAGAASIKTNLYPTWQNGAKIVIAPSTLPVRTRVVGTGTKVVENSVEAIEAEVRTITSNNGMGTLTLGAAMIPSGTDSSGLISTGTNLDYTHHGFTHAYTRPETVISTSSTLPAKTWTVDERAEVGLLTHNVKVQGEIRNDVEEKAGFGGHVMIMQMSGTGCICAEEGGGFGRFSNVEFYRMGQKRRIGRYPIHWHMLGAGGAGQFVKNCSIWHSYNRAITIHGTEHLVVEGNVAYDHVGHGIFLEDGSERFNEIRYNLALGTIRPKLGEELLPTDNSADGIKKASPATYWITNPNNIIDGNVAAGCVGNGFWFIFPKVPLGLSKTDLRFEGIKPNEEPLGRFKGNVAHSNAVAFSCNDSIDMDANNPTNTTKHTMKGNVGWNPVPTGTNSVSLENFTCYANNTGLYAAVGTGGGGNKVHYKGAMLADNMRNIWLATYETVEDSLVVAETGSNLLKLPSDNPDSGNDNRRYCNIIYDGSSRLYNSHVVGFNLSGSDNIYNAYFIRNGGAANKHANHKTKGLTFDDKIKPPIILFDEGKLPSSNSRGWSMTIRDLDGTLTGVRDETIISNHPMLLQMQETREVVNTKLVITPKQIRPAGGSEYAYMTTAKFGQIRFHYSGSNIGLNFPRVTIKRRNVKLAGTGSASTLPVNSTSTDSQQEVSYIYERSKINSALAETNHQLNAIVNADDAYNFSGTNTKGFYLYEYQFDAGVSEPSRKVSVTEPSGYDSDKQGWPPAWKTISVFVDDLLSSSDSALICIKKLGAAGGLTVKKSGESTQLAPKANLSALIQNTNADRNASYCVYNNDLYLRIGGFNSKFEDVNVGNIAINWSGTFIP